MKKISNMKWYMLSLIFCYPVVLLGLLFFDEKYRYYIKGNFVEFVKLYTLITASLLITLLGYKTFERKVNNPVVEKSNFRVAVEVNKFFIILILYSTFIIVYSFFVLIKYKDVVLTMQNDVIRAYVYPKIAIYVGHGVLIYIPVIVSLIFLEMYLSKSKKVFFVWFLAYFIGSYIPIFLMGQRTALVLPLYLLFFMLYEKYDDKKYLVYLVLITIPIIVLYTVFLKTAFLIQKNQGFLSYIIAKDLDMNIISLFILENTSIFHSKLLPTFGYGIYNVFMAFFPRSLMPYKGYHTALWVTYYYNLANNINFVEVNNLNYAVKFGVVMDLIINFGYVGGLISSFFVGMLLRWFDNVNKKYPSTYGITTFISINSVILPIFTIYTLLFPILLIEIIYFKFCHKELIKKKLKNQIS